MPGAPTVAETTPCSPPKMQAEEPGTNSKQSSGLEGPTGNEAGPATSSRLRLRSDAQHTPSPHPSSAPELSSGEMVYCRSHQDHPEFWGTGGLLPSAKFPAFSLLSAPRHQGLLSHFSDVIFQRPSMGTLGERETTPIGWQGSGPCLRRRDAQSSHSHAQGRVHAPDRRASSHCAGAEEAARASPDRAASSVGGGR